MGMESFYINFELKKNDKELLKQEIDDKTYYRKGLLFSGLESEDIVSISGCTFSFLSACNLVYKLLKFVTQNGTIINFETYGEKRLFDFESKAQFINFMYSKWESKLDSVNEQLGAFLISPSQAYKAQRKLSKKYYSKF